MHLKSISLLTILFCVAGKASESSNNNAIQSRYYYLLPKDSDLNEWSYIILSESAPKYEIGEEKVLYNEQSRVRRDTDWKDTRDINNGLNSFDPTSSVFTYSTGAKYKGNGNMFNSGLSVIPGFSNLARIDKSSTYSDHSTQQLNAFETPGRVFIPNFQTSHGYIIEALKNEHINGVSTVSVGQTGVPNNGFINLLYPVYRSKSDGDRNNFGSGTKPNHQLGFHNYGYNY